jgi:hypothetical protein
LQSSWHGWNLGSTATASSTRGERTAPGQDNGKQKREQRREAAFDREAEWHRATPWGN